MTKFVIDEWQVKMVREYDAHGPKVPYKHIYAFVKNSQHMTAHDFKTTSAAIHDILDKKGVNFGILMFMHGTYVFTETTVDLNALIIKLADGINFNGEVTETFGNLSYLNKTLGR